MTSEGFKRKSAAILSEGFKDYSRLVRENEKGTALRNNLGKPKGKGGNEVLLKTGYSFVRKPLVCKAKKGG